MNAIKKKPLHTLGYDFIPEPYRPKDEDQYYLRNLQNRSGIQYRNLTAHEIEKLVRNNNTSDDWNKICVSNEFNPELVKNCNFFGLVRIGKLEAVYLEYHNVCLPVGLYNSTIISSDFGDNVVVSNVNYLSHYIIGNEVMISNVHELHVTSHAKFGNGILKEGEEEAVRIWLEVRNENAGRRIMPFHGMLPGDAFIWSQYREDKGLLERLGLFTEKRFDKRRGYYGKIGDRTVIKNTSIIKDVWIGTDAYIKGANKLKNLTIDSAPNAQTQIGEGCEIVNGIIGIGCRVFYGVKAVRFIMASHSQLKYGARLLNSYLGNNATISCCEVLNSLIYPAHEQHHNNSFLCAALVMGQSNMAAGATIGSNHNSRAADGELIAGRGFWPGLCVSLKHNSKFASFSLLAKGDYPAELNITLPFSLISNDEAANRLVIMPAYWFQYNMYALARNAAKYGDRDKRKEKIQHIEYDFLAPDTIVEIVNAIALLQRLAATASGMKWDAAKAELEQKGKQLLADPAADSLVLQQAPFENSGRPVLLLKAHTATKIFTRLVVYHFIKALSLFASQHQCKDYEEVKHLFNRDFDLGNWINIGGQLMPAETVSHLISDIKNEKINSWDEVHLFYKNSSAQYNRQKLEHAFAAVAHVLQISTCSLTPLLLHKLSDEALATRQWMTENIKKSRAKDYQNDFRKMVYDNDAQMNEVVGVLDENVFIQQQEEACAAFAGSIKSFQEKYCR